MQKLAIFRPINLIIIALNIVIVDFFIFNDRQDFQDHFILLVLKIIIMVSLAASGNVINDYFDQKSDAINRPAHQKVGRSISVQGALRWHILLTALALVFSAVLSLMTGYLLFFVIASIYAFVLYIYTPVIKRIPVLGNLTIAACVAFLPIWTILGNDSPNPDQWIRIMWLCLFALISNFIREWVKDVQDEAGDRHQGYKTAPVRWGVSSSKKIIQFLWLLMTGLAVVFCYEHFSYTTCILVALPQVMGWFPLWIVRVQGDWSRISFLLKLNMVLGMMGILFS